MLWNTAGFANSVLVAFFLSPYLIRSLGDAQYGVYALMAEITGYYGLADLGTRGAVGYFVARYAADRKLEPIREVAHSAFSILSLGALCIVVLSLGLAYLAPYWFKLDTVSPADARKVILIMSGTFALSLPAAVFPAILYGFRRLDLTNTADLCYRLGSAALAVATLRAGGDLAAFVIAQSAATLARSLIEGTLVWRLGFGFRLLPGRPSRERVKDLLGYGVRNTAINVTQMIATQLDLVVIASFLSAKWVTAFAIARSLITYYAAFISTITRSFTPQFTHLHATGQQLQMIHYYLRVSKLTSLLGAWMGAGIVVFGNSFLRLWVGPSYVEGSLLYRSDVVMALLTAGVFWRVLQSIAWQVLLGTRRLRFLTWITSIEAISNLGLSILLVRSLGLAGVALGTMVPQVICYGLVMPVYMVRAYQIGWWRYLQNVFVPALLVIASLTVTGGLLVHLWTPQSWAQLFSAAAAASLVTGLAAYVLGLNGEERRHVRAKLALVRPSGPPRTA
jgi:O-antigen/teichoic acid export membrane protein